MAEARLSPKSYRFGAFEFDPDSRQLAKRGLKLKISGQPMEILGMLLEHPGELVTREELRQRLWAADTFVDFEHSLNAAVNKLREALGDDSLHPRYVETVPRRGYRFIDTIEEIAAPQSSPQMQAAVETVDKTSPNRYVWMLIAALVLVSASVWLLSRKSEPQKLIQVLSNRQVTTTPGLAMTPTFSPDGSQMAYATDRGKGSEIYVRQLDPGGAELQLTSDGQQNLEPAWSPDGESLAYHSMVRKGIWLVRALGGPPRRVTEFGSHPRWSSDGKWITFQSGAVADLSTSTSGTFPPSTIWIVRPDGTDARQITRLGLPEGGHGEPSWSPDSKHIVFTSTLYTSAEIYSVDVETGVITQVLPAGPFYAEPIYSADGEHVFYGGISGEREWALWQVKVSPKTSAPEGTPSVLLYGRIKNLQLSKDGKKILYTAVSTSSSLESMPLDTSMRPNGNPTILRTDVGCRSTVPRLSPDGERIAFNSCWEGSTVQVWTMRRDGQEAAVLTSDAITTGVPNWSPDSKRVLYLAGGADSSVHVLRATDIETRQSKTVTEIKQDVAQMNLSPDGKKLAFGSIRDGKLSLWLLNMETLEARRLTDASKSIGFPTWSPDGTSLIADLRSETTDQLVIVPVNGGPVRQLTFDDGLHFPGSWSSDGQHIVFAGLHNYIWNLYDFDLKTNRERPLSNYSVTAQFVRYPQVSPLGDQIVYEHVMTTGNIWMLELK